MLSFHENSNIIVANGFNDPGHPSNKSDLIIINDGLLKACLQINLCEQLFSHQIEHHCDYCQAKKEINTSKNQLEVTFDLPNKLRVPCWQIGGEFHIHTSDMVPVLL